MTLTYISGLYDPLDGHCLCSILNNFKCVVNLPFFSKYCLILFVSNTLSFSVSLDYLFYNDSAPGLVCEK